MDLQILLDSIIWNNNVSSWLIAISISLLSYFALLILLKIIIKKFAKFVKLSRTRVDDLVTSILKNTKTIFLIIISLYFGTKFMNFTENVKLIILTVSKISLILQTGFWINQIVINLTDWKVQPRYRNTVNAVAKTAIWVIVCILSLDNIPGVEVTALVASLGITGLAVSLALQGILGDVFSAISIAIDKPFEVGDYISLGPGYEGRVEKVGWKSTRIISPSGERLVLGNTDLLKSRVRNYMNQDNNLKIINFRIGYGNTYEKIQKISILAKEVITEEEQATFVCASFDSYAPAYLNFEITYFVTNIFNCEIKEVIHNINMNIYKKFEESEIQLV